MSANAITLWRIGLSFLVIVLFMEGNWMLQTAAVLLTMLVIYLDSLDGIVARRRGECSDLGAFLDIAGDRIVEHLYWVLFALMDLVSLWVPLIVLSRSFLVDGLRTVAYAGEGRTPFGNNSMVRSRWAFWLTASRPSRAIYGAGKLAAFVALGALAVLQNPAVHLLPAAMTRGAINAVTLLVWLVVGMNLLRGLPVLWEGRRFFSRPGISVDAARHGSTEK